MTETLRLFKIKRKGDKEYNLRYAPKVVMEQLQLAENYIVIPQSKTASKRYFKNMDKANNKTKVQSPNLSKRISKYIDSHTKFKNNRKLKLHEVKGSLVVFNMGTHLKIFKVWTRAMLIALEQKFGKNYTIKQGVIVDPRKVNSPITLNLN